MEFIKLRELHNSIIKSCKELNENNPTQNYKPTIIELEEEITSSDIETEIVYLEFNNFTNLGGGEVKLVNKIPVGSYYSVDILDLITSVREIIMYPVIKDEVAPVSYYFKFN